MRIVDGVLEKVESSDIVDGFFDIPAGVTRIGKGAFSECQFLKNISIPKSVTYIDDGAFYGCQSLMNVNLPNSVTSIGESAFFDCQSLKSINIPNGVTSIKCKTFYGCRLLECINISNGVTSIEDGAFYGCQSLMNVNLPNSVTSIGESAFFDCQSLKSINIPDKVTNIEEYTFCNCQSLESVNLSDGVISIKESAFNGCQLLKSINIPDSVISIGEYAFSDCFFLESINIPNGVTSIKCKTFYGCRLLECINIPNGVTSIEDEAFYGCQSLKSINLTKNITNIGAQAFDMCDLLSYLGIDNNYIPLENTNNDDNQTISVLKNYLYLYANSFLKEKYENIEDFLSNSDIRKIFKEDVLCSRDAILKFKNIFYKMRKRYDVDAQLFAILDLETTKNFDFKIWNEIKNIYNWSNSIEMMEAFSEMIEIFGLFHSDSGRQKRIQQFKDLFNKHVRIPKESYLSNPKFANLFKEVTVTSYILKDGIDILEEYDTYLTDRLSFEEVRKIKKLSGSYGKRLNDFVKKSYVKTKEVMYELIDSSKTDVVNELFSSNISGYLNYHNLHQMFDGCDKKYDGDFYLFLVDNLPFILKSEKLQASVKSIQSRFENIKKYYLLYSGIENVTLGQAVNYIDNIRLDCDKGNFELLSDAQKAGVVEQDAFDYYQKVYEKNDIRRLYSLVRRSNIYEIDGYTIKAELLRKDDSFGMLIGEKNYTNCCQVFGGVGHNCMAHAVNSDDGGIFVTRLLKNGEWILLTESWDWQNNNVYCHDNIEGTEYFKNGPDKLKKAVAEAIRLDGEYIIEKSRDSVSKYIECRRKVLDRSLSADKEQELEELRKLEDREVIRVVTCGSKNDDLGVSNYYKQSISVNSPQIINGQKFVLSNFQPVDYNATQAYFDSNHKAYTDSCVKQVVVAGSIEDLCYAKAEKLVPIYRDERRLVLEEASNIRDYTINKMTNMEQIAYPEEMRIYQDSSKDDFKDSHIYLGEDWYLVYEKRENNGIYISDLAKVEPSIEDERATQYKEMMDIIYGLIRKYDFIDADLKEDTSYLLYLVNKKLGYLEQIGEDVSYPFARCSDRKIVSDEEQEQILRQRKSIKNGKNPESIMHKVKFKKGRL